MDPGDAQDQQLQQQLLQEPLVMDPQDVPQQQLDLHQQIHQALADIEANLNYFENRIAQIKQNARQQFANFNGQNFQQIDFGYILNYHHLRHQVDVTRNAILDIVNNWNVPDFQQALGQIQQRLNRIIGDLDNLRDFLIIGGYAAEEQLNQGWLLNQYPWRFRYQENLQHWINRCFQMVHHLLIHAPQPNDYNDIEPMAQHALGTFQNMNQEQQNDPALVIPLFAYIQFYRELSKRVEKARDMVEDILQLVMRIIELNWEQNWEHFLTYNMFHDRLWDTRTWCMEKGQQLVDLQYATWHLLDHGLVEGFELPQIFANELVEGSDDGSETESSGSSSEDEMDDSGYTTMPFGSSENDMDDGGSTTESFSD